MPAIAEALKQQVLRITSKFREAWQKDLESMSQIVSEACPKWELFADTLLKQPVLIKDQVSGRYYQLLCKLSPNLFKNPHPIRNYFLFLLLDRVLLQRCTEYLSVKVG